MIRLRPLILVVLLASLGALGLTGGCTESGSLPTQPTVLEPAGPWSVIYPITTTESLRGVWGVDADDMWAVGDHGTILHYDGERCRVVESPVDQDLDGLHGSDRDDIWCWGRHCLLHWDGRRWRAVFENAGTDFVGVWCAGPDDVFVTATIRGDTCWYPEVRHFDGAVWQDLEFPREPDGWVHTIWQPRPGGPLLVYSSQGLWRYEFGEWQPCRNQFDIRDVDGDLAIGTRDDIDGSRLLRFDALGEPYTPCPESDLEMYGGWARVVVAGPIPLVSVGHDLVGVTGQCGVIPYEADLGESIRDLTVPARTGPASSTVFAVGYDGLFTRGAWNPDLTLTWTDLVPGPTERLEGALSGTADLLFASASHGNLAVLEDGIWRIEEFEGIPYHAELRLLDDETLVAWRYQYIAIRHPDGAWSTLPDNPPLRHLWIDSTGEAVGIDNQMWMWIRAGGAWTRTDSLDVPISSLDGRAHDEIYARFEDGVLRRFDGSQWHHVIGDENEWVRAMYVSPWSDDIYLNLLRENTHAVTVVLRDGQLVEMGGLGYYWQRDYVCEVALGDFYYFGPGELEHLVAGEWREVEMPDTDRGTTAFWGHPDQGLFLLDWDGDLHHRPPTVVSP